MFNVKISLPTYKANSWGQLDKQGEVQISSEVDSLSDGYAALKLQIDELLAQSSAENRIVVDLQKLDSEIQRRQSTLRDINQKVQVADAQLRRLQKFLRLLGIDPTSSFLEINNKVLAAISDELEEVVAVEAEVDPIPFDSSDYDLRDNSHQF